MSYTGFKYSDLKVGFSENQDSVFVQCKIENTGKMAGDEVVELYYKDLVSSVTLYEMQLRVFERIHLTPGEKKQVDFVLLKDHLSLIDGNMVRVGEPGDFELLIGSS